MSDPVPMQLWRLDSRVLAGFYQSDVVVIAPDREAAIFQVFTAVAEKIDAEIADMNVAFIGCEMIDPGDDDYQKNRSQLMTALRAEAEANLQCIETGRLVFLKS